MSGPDRSPTTAGTGPEPQPRRDVGALTLKDLAVRIEPVISLSYQDLVSVSGWGAGIEAIDGPEFTESERELLARLWTRVDELEQALPAWGAPAPTA